MRVSCNDAPAVELDALELWVRDVDLATRALTPFGFEAESTSDAGCSDRTVACLRCGNVRVSVRQGRSPSDPVHRHVALHGDGIGDVRLVCDARDAVLDRASRHGMKVSFDGERPRLDVLGDGTILHSLEQRDDAARDEGRTVNGVLSLQAVDHVSYCLPWGTMDDAVHRYRSVLDLDEVPNDECAEIGERGDGMRSAVLRSSRGFTVVLTEPLDASSTGQTQRFVHAHAGPGVQHVAFAYPGLLPAVALLRTRGIAFLPVPAEHLERSHRRLRDRALPWRELREHGILVDADGSGMLLQLFTAPVLPPSSFFLELIHREGCTGFGAANVRGLFAAVDAAAHGG
jgi:4-hydroxymandelate synthase